MVAELTDIIKPITDQMGFRLVRVKMIGQGAQRVLQVMAERPDGTMDVEDCADLSRELSVMLDVTDPIEGNYSLEVSSPGIDRPLVSLEDYDRFQGYTAKIELSELIDGRRRFRGPLHGVEDQEVLIETEVEGKGRVILGLPFELIGEAKLVLTDDLIEASLREEKARAKENEKAPPSTEDME